MFSFQQMSFFLQHRRTVKAGHYAINKYCMQLSSVYLGQDYNFIKNRLQHWCFPVSFVTEPRNSCSEVFLKKGILKICSKFTGNHPCRSVISISLSYNIIESTLRHGCSPVNLLDIFREAFLKNSSGRLLLGTPLIDPYY